MYDRISITPFFMSCFIFVLFGSITTLQGKTVYAIPEHWPSQGNSQVNAYNILDEEQEGQIEFRQSYMLPESGACDVTYDPASNYLAITYENSEVIHLVNAKTMLSEGTTTATSASDLAGIVL